MLLDNRNSMIVNNKAINLVQSKIGESSISRGSDQGRLGDVRAHGQQGVRGFRPRQEGNRA